MLAGGLRAGGGGARRLVQFSVGGHLVLLLSIGWDSGRILIYMQDRDSTVAFDNDSWAKCAVAVGFLTVWG